MARVRTGTLAEWQDCIRPSAPENTPLETDREALRSLLAFSGQALIYLVMPGTD